MLQMKFQCIINLTCKALDLVGVYFSAIHKGKKMNKTKQ